MSRASVKETDDQSVDLPDRPISPHPNLVTPAGLAAIESEIKRFSAAHRAAVDKHDKAAIAAAQRELRYWSARRATAKLVSRQRTAPTSISGCGLSCEVRMGAGKRFA
jgi:transcription elongation GreA/GreB family factor